MKLSIKFEEQEVSFEVKAVQVGFRAHHLNFRDRATSPLSVRGWWGLARTNSGADGEAGAGTRWPAV